MAATTVSTASFGENRAVRHYHQVGLSPEPEPERDDAGRLTAGPHA